MANKYIVDLTAAEQEELCHLIKQGKPSARKVARAHMLLHAAEGATDTCAPARHRESLTKRSQPLCAWAFPPSIAPANGVSTRAWRPPSRNGGDRGHAKSWMANRKPL